MYSRLLCGHNVCEFNYSAALGEIGAMAQIIQADLAKVGVTLTLQPTDRPSLRHCNIR
jgi:ABC-type transport system substrate-binding protein